MKAQGLHTQSCLAFVMAFGRGEDLHELAQGSAKAALDFGGALRVIDFVLSNIRNSGIRQTVVACQYGSPSLIRHIRQSWPALSGLDGRVDILPAGTDAKGGAAYRGDASALFENIDVIDAAKVEHVLVVSGEHIYKMDYGLLLQDHIASGAPVTRAHSYLVEGLNVAHAESSADQNGSVVRLSPRQKAKNRGTPVHDDVSGGMDVYVFNWTLLRKFFLEGDEAGQAARDLEADILPAMHRAGVKLHAHDFAHSCVRAKGDDLHLSTIDTIDAYWHAHMDLIGTESGLCEAQGAWPIGGRDDRPIAPARLLPGAQGDPCDIGDCLIANGCWISGATLINSVLGTGVSVGSGTRVMQSVLQPGVSLGTDVHLSQTIITRGTVLPNGLRVGVDRREDAMWFRVTAGGITLINQEMLRRRARLLAG